MHFLKKPLFAVLALALMFNLTACDKGGGAQDSGKRTFSSAIAFNDFIVDEQNKIIKVMLAFSNHETAMSDKALGNEMIDDIVKTTEEAIEALDGVEPYEEGETLLKSAKALFQFYHDMADKDYREMVDIISKGEDMTDADLARIDEIALDVEKREVPLDNAFADAQAAFAKHYGMQIRKNEMQDEIDRRSPRSTPRCWKKAYTPTVNFKNY